MSVPIWVSNSTQTWDAEVEPKQLLGGEVLLALWMEPHGGGEIQRTVTIAPGDIPDLIKALADVLLEMAAETA
jgi:hypothetical protein